MSTNKRGGKKVVLTLSLPEEIATDIEKMAEIQNRSKANMLEHLVVIFSPYFNQVVDVGDIAKEAIDNHLIEA